MASDRGASLKTQAALENWPPDRMPGERSGGRPAFETDGLDFSTKPHPLAASLSQSRRDRMGQEAAPNHEARKPERSQYAA